MINNGLYIPEFVKIESIKNESEQVKSYRLKVRESFKPGQFFQVSVLGAGEVPISISSSPTEKGFLELTVRCNGRVTKAIHDLGKGAFLGLRGPYGNFFPMEELSGKNLVFVAGGIGLAPLRSSIKYALDNRDKYGKLCLLYGARRKSEIIFKDDLKNWKSKRSLDIHLTLDQGQKGWHGNTGVVTTLIDAIDLNYPKSAAFLCGPPLMIKYTIEKLLGAGLKDKDIFISLERYMACGVGKCGHCYMADKYVCTDGPIFSYWQLKCLKQEEVLV